MSWVRRLERYFQKNTREKGKDYFLDGVVRIDEASADYVRSKVRGDRLYTVTIGIEADNLVGSCTCPHYDQGFACKHLWATILAAESEDTLRSARDIQDLSLELESDSLFVDDESDGDDFSGPALTTNRSRYGGNFAAEPPSPWKHHLALLRMNSQPSHFNPPLARRRVIYAIDVLASATCRGLPLRVAACRQKKDGTWGRPALYENSIRNLSTFELEDRRILALLAGSRTLYGYYAGGEDSCAAEHVLMPGAYDVVVPMLCATGRLYLRSADGRSLSPDSIAWDGGEPWSMKIRVERDDDAGVYTMTGILTRGDEECHVAKPNFMVPGLTILGGRLSQMHGGEGTLRWARMLRQNKGLLTIPVSKRSEFLQELLQFADLPPIELPDDLHVDRRPLASVQLKIRPGREALGANANNLAGEVSFDYGGVAVPEGHPTPGVFDSRANQFFLRDLPSEASALERLPALGFRLTGESQAHRWELAPSRLPAAVQTLVGEGWRVDAEGKRYRRPGQFAMNLASHIDWFELNGNADFEGVSAGIPQILKAVARGEQSVRLDDGTYGLLPETWLKRYRLVASFGKENGAGVRYERHQAGLLDALLAAEAGVTFDEGFLRLREELAGFAGIHAAEPHDTFKGTLRDYQRDGLGWLRFLRQFGFGGCLADDMGLGKTVQVLALLDAVSRETEHPILIVVPRSLIFNWKQEAARFTPLLRVLDHTGVGRKDRWDEIDRHDIVLTTYGTLRRDASRLKDIRFDTVVLDEAQAIKNASTESAKAARLLKADHRLVLTGTPVENHLSDLWSLLEFLNPGLLGSASVFREWSSEKNGATALEAAHDDSMEILSKALRPFILRRTKQQVARELPDKIEQTIYCELEPEQRRLYDELRAHYREALLGRIESVGLEKSRMQILESLLRLRQAACHPGLLDPERAKQGSAKLDWLIPQLQELAEEGHKALVFSQFTSLLAIVRRCLDELPLAYEYLDGRTRDRESRICAFQEDPHRSIFLISLKAGGLGLNLTAAEYVFLLDPWWNPAVEAQAIDRTHRIGQSRHVFAYRLVARDTVEEKILELQKTKRDLADAVIRADNSVLSGLTRENLELLLS